MWPCGVPTASNVYLAETRSGTCYYSQQEHSSCTSIPSFEDRTHSRPQASKLTGDTHVLYLVDALPSCGQGGRTHLATTILCCLPTMYVRFGSICHIVHTVPATAKFSEFTAQHNDGGSCDTLAFGYPSYRYVRKVWLCGGGAPGRDFDILCSLLHTAHTWPCFS